MKTPLLWLCLLSLSTFYFLLPTSSFAQGSLTPPAAPAPTMKTLDQIASTGIAINATNTPGDASSQFIISAPGSYYLTGNINGVSGKSAISIRADNITLDLNGFAMIGLAGGFSSSAIEVPSVHANLRIHNGAVQGWGSTGVLAFNASASQIENLRVAGSGGRGVMVGDDSSVSRCTVINSGSNGIQVGTGGTVLDCTVDIADNGILTGDKSAVTGCTARASVHSGFAMGEACAASRCLALDNGLLGFSSADHGVFTDCTARGNLNTGFYTGIGSKFSGCIAASNSGVGTNGISCSSVCTLQNCAAISNGGLGINVGSGGSIANCSSGANGGNGISASNSSVISCSATQNTGVGIDAATGCVVKDCAAFLNQGDGIRTSGDGVEVISNACVNNGSGGGTVAGIHVTGNRARIEGNTLTSNGRGLKVDNTGNLIIRNSAKDNGTNYDIVASNKVGPVVSAPDSAAILGSTGGAGIGSTDPWANISY